MLSLDQANELLLAPRREDNHDNKNTLLAHNIDIFGPRSLFGLGSFVFFPGSVRAAHLFLLTRGWKRRNAARHERGSRPSGRSEPRATRAMMLSHHELPALPLWSFSSALIGPSETDPPSKCPGETI